MATILRHLALALLAYVGLDFANPLMPGAVSFAVEDSVEGIRADRARDTVPALPHTLPPAPRDVVRAPAVSARSRPPRTPAATPRARPLARAATGAGRTDTSPPSAEDH
jgi:hypothetical protein